MLAVLVRGRGVLVRMVGGEGDGLAGDRAVKSVRWWKKKLRVKSGVDQLLE